MGMSGRLPPPQSQGLRPFRWGGLRTTLERNSENGTFSSLSWGMCITASTYLALTNDYMQYWRRLWALDSQLLWFEKQNLLEMGHWVQRKHASALHRQMDAKLRLQESGVPQSTLEREWKAQIEAQLASAPSS